MNIFWRGRRCTDEPRYPWGQSRFSQLTHLYLQTALVSRASNRRSSAAATLTVRVRESRVPATRSRDKGRLPAACGRPSWTSISAAFRSFVRKWAEVRSFSHSSHFYKTVAILVICAIVQRFMKQAPPLFHTDFLFCCRTQRWYQWRPRWRRPFRRQVVLRVMLLIWQTLPCASQLVCTANERIAIPWAVSPS